jgi:hypothetical protein
VSDLTLHLCVLTTFQANSKFIKAEQSQPKPGPNFSKKKAWISLDFLGDILVDKRDPIYMMLVIGDDQCQPPTFKPPLSLTTT